MNCVIFSVIIPFYNAESTIIECVNSVLAQSFENFEMILVDDGSADNSPHICDELAEKDERIKVIHKKNGGSSSARNVGMKEASGKYFLFLDSDDYWTNYYLLDDLMEIIKEKDCDLIIFDYSTNDALNKVHFRDSELEKKILYSSKSNSLRELTILDKIKSSAWSKMYKSTLLNDNRIYFVEGVSSEDIDWTARVLICSESIGYLDSYAYYYRPNNYSMSHNIKYKNIVDLCNNIKMIIEFSEDIKNDNYFEWYMNYCAYQYITFLNNAATYKDRSEIKAEIEEMKSYRYLLNYHCNKKVKLCYLFNKVFGYKLTIKILKIFLIFRG